MSGFGDISLYVIGYTTAAKEETDATAAKVAILAHVEAIRQRLIELDQSELFEEHQYAAGAIEDDGTDNLLSTLFWGWEVHQTQFAHLAQYPLPVPAGAPKVWFNLMGGTMRDELPVEGLDQLEFLVRCCEAVPQLGSQLGILGGGAIIPGLPAASWGSA